jgi:hypothetical protein
MAVLPFVLEIPKRSTTCYKGKETLEPGEEYYSALLEDETKPGYVRRDYCKKCWEDALKEEGKLFKSSWKAKVPPNTKVPKIKENYFEKAFRLLRDSMDDPEQHGEAFLLALFLARKKKLLLRQEINKDGKLYYLYENPATEEMLAVRKVDLTEIQQDKIQADMARKFKK